MHDAAPEPDHKAFLATLTAEDRARLTGRSDRAGLRHLALHAGLILVMGALIAARVPFWWVLVPAQGVALAFLFTLQHECTHKTPFAGSAINEWVGWAAGVILLQPFLWFRYFHLAHHRHTHDPDHDPELEAPKPEGWVALAWHVAAFGYWKAKAKVLWTNAFGTMRAPYLPAPARARLRREARGMIALYAAAAIFTAFVSPVLLWAWLVPLVAGFPVLRLYLLAEHGRCPHVANMFENTRTTFTNAAVRFLAWNMPYHAEHHAFPQVPFHRLADLHALIRDRLKSTSDGYAAFTADYVAGFDRGEGQAGLPDAQASRARQGTLSRREAVRARARD